MSGNRGNYGTPAGGGYLHDAVQELALLEERGEADGIDLIHLNDGEEEVAEGICCDVLQQTLYDPLARLDKFKQLRKDDISIEEDMLREMRERTCCFCRSMSITPVLQNRTALSAGSGEGRFRKSKYWPSISSALSKSVCSTDEMPCGGREVRRVGCEEGDEGSTSWKSSHETAE